MREHDQLAAPGDRSGQPSQRSKAALRVLIINFTLDERSPVLAWQASVAREIAERVQEVHVFTEWLGEFAPPPNLTFDAMPHRPFGVPRRLGASWLMLPRLMGITRRFRPDVCFVHMAHEWCYRIAPYLRARGIPVLLWYAHGSVPWKLYLSNFGASRIVTSTPEGFRIETVKRRIIGQAIDTVMFNPDGARAHRVEVVSVGRVSRRKRTMLLVEAMAHVIKRPELAAARLILVGPTLTPDDARYEQELAARAAQLGLQENVELRGPMSQAETAALYETATLHVNVSDTGSMDKTVLEALACGCPVVTSNVAFFDLLKPVPAMLIAEPTPEALADRICEWLSGRHVIAAATAAEFVRGRNDLGGWTDRIVMELQDLVVGSRRQMETATGEL
jgi:glycosyltransferase involved in cell wall biosynthesis